MNDICEIMHRFMNICEISLDGNVFSKEMLIKAYADFLSNSINKRKHNVGLILHSGSICFDALIVTYAAITNLMFNQTCTEDVLESLNVGDIVLYGEKKKQRYIFDGYVSGELCGGKKEACYIRLNQDDGSSTFVPEKSWRIIEPYNGSAKKLDGRGIRNKGREREDFFIEVLGIQLSDIPSVIDTSTVLVMPKEEADRLLRGISIRFGKKEAKLLDLVTASYFTEDEEHSYLGNAGKNEPVLKVCAKVSVARKLIFSKNGNSHIGLIVMGQDMINRGESELPELINRKSLQYVYVCTNVESEYVNQLLEENEDVETFACTKAFLAENASINVTESNYLTEGLRKQIETIREKENISIVVHNDVIDCETYNLFKKTLIGIKRNQYESEEKENFIIQAYSLFNLLMTAPFSCKDLKVCVEKEIISVESIDIKISGLERLADELGDSLRKEAYRVVEILIKFASYMEESSPKEVGLRNYIRTHSGESIAVIVPKAYYVSILKEKIWFVPGYMKGVSFYTPGRFDNTKLYDSIIIIGDFEGKRFNPYSCNASKKIIFLLYEPEERIFRYKKIKSVRDTKRWDKKSTIQLKNFKEELFEEAQVKDLVDDDNEIESYISQLDTVIDSVRLGAFTQGGRINLTTEIIAVATFSDETKAFFSKHYKAYVLDADKGLVKEVGVTELTEGDSIIFTKNNNDTKDIVDSILKQMIADGKLGEHLISAYHMSKEWQQSLIEYMQDNDLSPKEIVQKMIALKVPVQEPTIIRWLDEDTHTVGPRNIDSLRAIGNLTGNENLQKNAESYFEACREVRSIRRRILGEIGRAIINKIGGNTVKENGEFAEVYEKVDSLAEVLQIERIVPTERILPLSVANRPVNL